MMGEVENVERGGERRKREGGFGIRVAAGGDHP